MDAELALLSKTTVSTAVAAKTPIYAVPDNYNCVLSHALFVSAGDQAVSRISIGQASDTDDFLADRVLSNINSANDVALLLPDSVKIIQSPEWRDQNIQKLYTENTIIMFDCKTWVGVAANTLLLIGVLYE